MLLLHLIYRDLADRIPQHKINQENFLLFFQKNGLWGERLFREFDADETGLVSEAEFICGIGTASPTQAAFSSQENQMAYEMLRSLIEKQ